MAVADLLKNRRRTSPPDGEVFPGSIALAPDLGDEAAPFDAVQPSGNDAPQPGDAASQPSGDDAPQPQPQPQPVVSVVEKLERDAQAAAEAFAVSKENYAGALVDAAEGRLEAPQLAGYRAAYEMARERALEADMAVATARDRETARRLAEARAQSAAAWSRAGEMADLRVDALARLDDAASAFAEAWAGVLEANAALHGATPVVADADGAQMRLGSIENLIRVELARRGVGWAHDLAPSLLLSRRAFAEIMRETPAIIRGWGAQFGATINEQ